MTTELPLLPVGKDCDCGQPLVWRDNRQSCAVYGAHGYVAVSDVEQNLIRTYGRNPFAPGAALVDALSPMRKRRLRVVA